MEGAVPVEEGQDEAKVPGKGGNDPLLPVGHQEQAPQDQPREAPAKDGSFVQMEGVYQGRDHVGTVHYTSRAVRFKETA